MSGKAWGAVILLLIIAGLVPSLVKIAGDGVLVILQVAGGILKNLQTLSP